MEKTLKGIVQYARKNYFSYWAILGIDTALSVLCSLLAYAVIHYMAYVPMSDLQIYLRVFGVKCCRSLIIPYLSKYDPFFSSTRVMAYYVCRIIQDSLFVGYCILGNL